MSVANIISISVLVVALATFGWGIFSYFGANPKRRLQYRVRVVPLMQQVSSYADRLKVTFDGQDLPDPHLVEVGVRATGRVDIRREDFDGGVPLAFELGDDAKPYDDDPESTVFCLKGSRLLFLPNLIPHKGGEYLTSFICAGRPKVSLIEPHQMANTIVTSSETLTRQEFWAAYAIMGRLFGWPFR